MGVCDESGARMSGEFAVRSMASMHDRGNGLGGGFAGYGIYPDFPHAFCFHMLYSDEVGKDDTEYYLARQFVILHHEPIPTKSVKGIQDEPILWRYFLEISDERLAETQLTAEDYVVHAVMDINAHINGAFVASSGRNMGAFKGVGFPEEIGEFYRLDEYQGWTWTGHGRFPTNTPGWWGGAHPFCLLDYSIVHNGEISSYGINQRYLEMFGYQCTPAHRHRGGHLPLRPDAAPPRAAGGDRLQGPGQPLLEGHRPHAGGATPALHGACAWSTARRC